MTVLLGCALLGVDLARAGEEPWFGLYIYGHETETFQPCGGVPLWVRGTAATLGPLRREYSRLTTSPYEATYVELFGRVIEPAETGFAASYPGQFVIERIESIRALRPGDCRAEGVSPSMTLDGVSVSRHRIPIPAFVVWAQLPKKLPQARVS